MPIVRHRAVVVPAAFAALLTSRLAIAQTWNGGSTLNSNWSSAGNWSGGVAPANNGTANVVFAGSTRTAPNADVAWNVNSIQFAGGAATFAIGGQALTVQSGGISNLSGTTQGITSALALGASQTWSSSGGVTTFTGPTVALGTNTLTFGGSGNINVSNAISGTGAVAVNLSSATATVTLTGSATNGFTGGFNLANGTAALAKSGTGALAGSVTVGDGTGAASSAQLLFNSNFQTYPTTDVTVKNDGLLNLNSRDTSVHNLSLTGGKVSIGTGQLTLYGDISQTGPAIGTVISSDGNSDIALDNTSHNVYVGAGDAYLAFEDTGFSSGTLVKTGDGAISLDSTSNPGLSITVQGGTIITSTAASLGPGTLTFTAGALEQGTGVPIAVPNQVVINGSMTVDLSGLNGSFSFTGGITALGNSSINMQSAVVLPLGGNIVASGAGNSLTFNGPAGAVVALDGAAYATYSGTLVVGGASTGVTLRLDSGDITGTVVVTAGNTFVGGALAFLEGTVDNGGTLSLPSSYEMGGLISRVPYALPGGSFLSLYNSGLDNESEFTLAASSTLSSDGPLVNNDLIDGQGTLSGAGSLVNYGVLSPTTGTILLDMSGTNYGNIPLGAQTLRIGAGATLVNRGAITLASAQLPGAGTLVNGAGGVLSGTGIVSVSFTNAVGGSVVVTSGALSIPAGFGNAGTVQMAGATGVLTGGPIINTGSVQGFGVVGNAINNTTGTVEAIGGTLSITGGLTNAAGGMLAAGTGGKLLVSPGLATNAGLISLAGGTFDNGGSALDNTGSVAGYGILRTGGLTNDGTVTLTGGTTTVNGPVTNSAGKNFRVQYSPAVFTGYFQNNGQLYVTSTTATFAGGSGGSGPMGVPPPVAPGTSASLGGTGGTVVSPGGVLLTDGLTQGSLTIQGVAGNPGTVRALTREPTGATPAAGRAVGPSVSVLGTLSIASDAGALAGTFDLADNDLVLTATPEAVVDAYVASWYAGGTRAGAGLASSLAGRGTGPDALATLGVITNADGRGGALFSTFDGVPVVSPDVLVKYTYVGDTNLDGVVDGSDLANLLAGLQGHLAGWVNGDLNYDGVVDNADLTLLLASLGGQGAPFASPGGTSGSVPEPSALAWTTGAVAALRRRRR